MIGFFKVRHLVHALVSSGSDIQAQHDSLWNDDCFFLHWLPTLALHISLSPSLNVPLSLLNWEKPLGGLLPMETSRTEQRLTYPAVGGQLDLWMEPCVWMSQTHILCFWKVYRPTYNFCILPSVVFTCILQHHKFRNWIYNHCIMTCQIHSSYQYVSPSYVLWSYSTTQ